MQGKGFAGDVLPRDDEDLVLLAALGVGGNTDEEIRVLVFQAAVVMEIEVPGLVAIAIAAPADGHPMAPQAGIGDAQGYTDATVDQQIVAARGRRGTHPQPHLAELAGYQALRPLVLVYAVDAHIGIDAAADVEIQ